MGGIRGVCGASVADMAETVERTCILCGKPIAYQAGRGRPPTMHGHHRRANDEYYRQHMSLEGRLQRAKLRDDLDREQAVNGEISRLNAELERLTKALQAMNQKLEELRPAVAARPRPVVPRDSRGFREENERLEREEAAAAECRIHGGACEIREGYHYPHAAERAHSEADPEWDQSPVSLDLFPDDEAVFVPVEDAVTPGGDPNAGFA
jgi:hypothetical protein